MLISKGQKTLNKFLDVCSMIVKETDTKYQLFASDRKLTFVTIGYSLRLEIKSDPDLLMDDVLGLEYGFYNIRKTPSGNYDLSLTEDNKLFGSLLDEYTKKCSSSHYCGELPYTSYFKYSQAVLTTNLCLKDFDFKIIDKLSCGLFLKKTLDDDLVMISHEMSEQEVVCEISAIIYKHEQAQQESMYFGN